MKAYPPPGAAQDGKRTHGVAKWQVPRGVEVTRFWFWWKMIIAFEGWSCFNFRYRNIFLIFIVIMKILSNLEDGDLFKATTFRENYHKNHTMAIFVDSLTMRCLHRTLWLPCWSIVLVQKDRKIRFRSSSGLFAIHLNGINEITRIPSNFWRWQTRW